MAQTKYVNVTGYAEYAKVFPENRDMPGMTDHPGVNKMLKQHDGQYSMNFYPENEDEMKKLFGPLSEKMYGGGDRLKEGNPELGLGKFISLKRKHKDIKQKANGEEIDLGGTPQIVHWDEDSKGKQWSYENDGLIGNGSKVIVKFTVYGEGETQSVRLEKVGIIDHVPFEMAEGDRF